MELQNVTVKSLTNTGLNEHYQYDIKVFNGWAGNRQVTPALIQAFFEDMREKRASATLQRYKAALKQSLLKSFGTGLTLSQRSQLDTYFKEIKPGKRDPGISAERCLNRDELKAIKKVSGYKTQLIIQALYEMACRVSELVNIRVSDCTIQGEGVLVTIRHGKGNKSRVVFLNVKTYNAIRKAWRGSEYLFEHQGKRLHRGTIYTLLKRAGHHIDKHVTPHMMRHSWASLSIGELGLSAVSQYLGHSTPAVTAASYLHGRAPMGDVLAVNQLIAG